MSDGSLLAETCADAIGQDVFANVFAPVLGSNPIVPVNLYSFGTIVRDPPYLPILAPCRLAKECCKALMWCCISHHS